MQALLSGFPDLDVRLLSIDTAIGPKFNIHDKTLWGFLISVGYAGRILGLLQGPPCETWTTARHIQQYDQAGNPVRGPRPVRTVEDPWGISLLSCKELAQVEVGTSLLLKGAHLATIVAVRGGVTLLEHPAPSLDPTISSIWRTGLFGLLTRKPCGPFYSIRAAQWKYGSCGVKPTQFLVSKTDLSTALRDCQDPLAVRPTGHLIGRHADGSYKTYPGEGVPAPPESRLCTVYFLLYETMDFGTWRNDRGGVRA